MKWMALTVLLFSMGLMGCESPCDALAKTICETSGATSKACEEANTAAANARTQEQRACERVTAMTNTLSKNR